MVPTRNIQEVATVSLLGAAALFTVAGSAIAPIADDTWSQAGRTAVAMGLLAAVAAVVLSAPLDSLRRLRANVSGGTAYDALRGRRSVRVASMLMQLLEIVAAVVIGIRLAAAAGLVDLEVSAAVLERSVLVLGAALAVATLSALGASLLTAPPRPRTTFATTLAGLALGAAGLLALAATTAALDRAGAIEAWVLLGPEDAAMLALAGQLAVAFAVVRMRSLPTLTAMVYEERGLDRGRALGASKATAVLVPAIVAFALLIVVFLLFLLFGIGAGDLVLNVTQSPLLVGVMAFLLIALLASLGIAFALARTSKGDQALFKILPDAEVRRRRTIQVASAIVATAFFAVALLAMVGLLPEGLWLHTLCLGLLSALGPYGFYRSREHARIRRLEERFPDFLRDIASSHKGGLTLHQAATIAARGEYGDLTPEVRKMADQLSWNVSFVEALDRFAERVQTPLVQRAVSLIRQADRSGGATTDVLLAAARDAREIKNLENERRTTMGLYTVVVYITFFVFLGVAAVLYAQFAPQIIGSAEAVRDIGSDDAAIEQFGGSPSFDLADYERFYFLAAIMQGLGDGIIAGLLGSGKAVLGLRHSFLMVLISYVTFAFLL